MDVILFFDVFVWQYFGGVDIVIEIVQQFVLWEVFVQDLLCVCDCLQVFFGDSFDDFNQCVLFIGVGSFGFIVEMVVDVINVQWLVEVCVVYIISLLIYLVLYLQCDCLILLVLFGCSGFSLESVVVVDCVCSDVDDVCFFDIICNVDGELVCCGVGCVDICILLMLLVSCDCVFVMISSLICMLLVVLIVFDCLLWDVCVVCLKQIVVLVCEGQVQWDVLVVVLVQCLFNCVIYFGSGLLEVLVCECVLKVLELIVGCVLVLVNMLLGFCYGLKLMLDGNILVVVLCSVQLFVCCYEQDLLEELCCDGVVGQVLVIGLYLDIGVDDDYIFIVLVLDDLWLVLVWLGFVQLFVLQCLVVLGLILDNLFLDGIVNCVVKGVIIYYG